MAASSKENDYYHILCSGLKTHESQLTSYAYNFSAWEMLSYDRAESIDIIDGYLSDNLDLVVIQLGENVNDLDSFEDDFEYLIKYISLKAPKAKIIIGNFWSKSKTDDLKNNIAKKVNGKN